MGLEAQVGLYKPKCEACRFYEALHRLLNLVDP